MSDKSDTIIYIAIVHNFINIFNLNRDIEKIFFHYYRKFHLLT